MTILVSDVRDWDSWTDYFLRGCVMADTDRGGPVDQCSTEGQGVSLTDMRERAIERLVDNLQKSERILAERSSRVTLENVDRAFAYQPWDKVQTECGDAVRDALVFAAKQILRSVPAGALRTRALNNLIDARMLANAGITFRGEF